jgi:predicted SAM-dependent methyltransferase
MEDSTAQREHEQIPAPAVPVRRLNWGCGETGAAGWINSDLKTGDGVDLACDILQGLPLESDSIDYAVSIHALPEIHYTDLADVLRELRRVLKPGGVLRLALPDLDRGIEAYRSGDSDYFLIPDDEAKAIGAKFVTQMVWYGWSRSLFTYDFTEEILRKAGFTEIVRCDYGKTASPFPEIVELDSREKESLFVEATK